MQLNVYFNELNKKIPNRNITTYYTNTFYETVVVLSIKRTHESTSNLLFVSEMTKVLQR